MCARAATVARVVDDWPQSVDVLIAGGGPAGLSTAQALCEACPGARVLVVHRDAQIGLPVRTSGGSWLKCLRALDVPDHLHHPLRTLHFASPRVLSTTTFGDDRPVVLDVTATYRWLAAQAERAGARVVTGALATAVRMDRGRSGARAALEAGGTSRTVHARWVVDATGVARTLLSQSGMLARFARLGVGAEYEFVDESSGAQRHTGVLFVGTRFAPAGYGWVFPCPGGRVRVGVGVIKPDVHLHPRPLLDAFMASDEPARLGLRLGPLIDRHFGVIPSDHAPQRSVFGALAAVGDSACHALPLVGEGIRYSIESGRVLGRSLASALQGDAHAPGALARYEAWWDGTYRAAFARAQQANLKMARFTDAQWDAAARFLGALPPDDLACALRVELSPWGWLRGAIRRPRAVVQFLTACAGAGDAA